MIKLITSVIVDGLQGEEASLAHGRRWVFDRPDCRREIWIKGDAGGTKELDGSRETSKCLLFHFGITVIDTGGEDQRKDICRRQIFHETEHDGHGSFADSLLCITESVGNLFDDVWDVHPELIWRKKTADVTCHIQRGQTNFSIRIIK